MNPLPTKLIALKKIWMWLFMKSALRDLYLTLSRRDSTAKKKHARQFTI